MKFKKKMPKSKFAFVLAVFFLLILILCWLRGDFFLTRMGKFLLVVNNPVKSDIIVTVRESENSFSRTMEAASLFHKGYAERIFVSTSLADLNCLKLHKLGVSVQCGQSRIKDILIQLGVCNEKILLGNGIPGGGTKGEAARVKKMMLEQGYEKALIVTSWWHTRRAQAIYDQSMAGTNIRAVVVAASDEISKPSNWWNYRYKAISVFEEFPKLLIHYLHPSSNLTFVDDPA